MIAMFMHWSRATGFSPFKDMFDENSNLRNIT
jgi:hypothetical protein